MTFAQDTPAEGRPEQVEGRLSSGVYFDRLVAIMHTLRSPQGCPWDRQQTLESLRRFVLEETYEVLDAIDRGDYRALEGELGDLLFEVVFLAQICAEQHLFTIADSLIKVVDKLVRRHPHVFGVEGLTPSRAPTPSANAQGASEDSPEPMRNTQAQGINVRGWGQAPLEESGPASNETRAPSEILSPDQVKERWEEIKAQEREAAGERQTLLGSLPKTLPALLRAYEIGARTAVVGFDWTEAREVLVKVDEELEELRHAVAAGDRAHVVEEFGDLLFSMANLARKLGIEPEAALRTANEKFTRRFGELERRFEERGRPLREATLQEMEAEWERIKSSR